jgi:hypothetical protein
MDATGEEECTKIFSSFWALGNNSVQNAYLAGLTDVCEVKRKTKSGRVTQSQRSNNEIQG